MASEFSGISTTNGETSITGVKFMLRALRYRNYRLFFLGQGVSLIGTWLTTTATSWLVLSLARGPMIVQVATVLGVVRFAGQIPMSAIAPMAGVLVDRWNRHVVLMVTQAFSMIQSAMLAILTFNHHINVPWIIGLSVFQGLINAFDAPARQAFVVEMVENREDLPNAIALNSSMFNGARLVGPAIGGVMIASLGEGVCFAIDAVSYLAVLIALAMMRLLPREAHPRPHGAWQELKEGFAYALGFAPVRALLLLTALISFTAAGIQTLLPIFADEVASKTNGATVFGFLGASIGIGSLAGAIYLASRRSIVGLGRVIAISAAVGGAAMVGFAATRSLPIMLITSAISGLAMIVTFAASNTLLQTIVEDDMRGRLMSLFIVAVMGAAPLGSLASGWLADRIGAPFTVILAGIASILGACLFLIKIPSLRALVTPIYIRKGILPEVATGLQAADRLNVTPET
ncbi:MAG TPA: MFS transporter [Tepidisphaeraceae bacterium]|nr:MFS transporter [Tepidisphaeraceae bacterium]